MITEQMKAGTYVSPSNRTRYDIAEEDPKVIEAYDVACAALHHTSGASSMPTLDQIHKSQQHDSEAQSIRTDMNTTSQTAGHVLKDDIVMHQLINPFTKEVHMRPFIPSELRNQMILACHNDLKGAHYSFIRTHATLMPHAYWPDMMIDINMITTIVVIADAFNIISIMIC